MLSPTLFQQLEAALQGLHYGSIQLVVHEARIVRIERLERIRLSAAQQGLSDRAAEEPHRLTNSPEAFSQQLGGPTPSKEARHE